MFNISITTTSLNLQAISQKEGALKNRQGLLNTLSYAYFKGMVVHCPASIKFFGIGRRFQNSLLLSPCFHSFNHIKNPHHFIIRSTYESQEQRTNTFQLNYIDTGGLKSGIIGKPPVKRYKGLYHLHSIRRALFMCMMMPL